MLNYALPATLFVSIANSTRERLFSDSSMLIVSIIVLVGWYLAAFVVAKRLFHHTTQEAGIAGLSAGAPTVGFLGIAVLSPLFGAEAALSVAVVALVVNVIQVPLGVFFVAPAGTKPSAALVHAMKQPVVLAPLIAVALVLLGIRFPPFADAPLALIGHATSGVAVFAAGLVLSAHKFHLNAEVVWNTVVKLLLMPACMLFLAMAFGITGEKLEQMVILAALPPAFTGIVLAGRYQTYVEMASSTLIVTAILFAGAAPMWIAIARSFAG